MISVDSLVESVLKNGSYDNSGSAFDKSSEYLNLSRHVMSSPAIDRIDNPASQLEKYALYASSPFKPESQT